MISPSTVVHFQSNAIRGFLRLLLDTCSQVTLDSDSFIRRFRINTQQSPNPISVAVGGMKVAAMKQCNLALQSKFKEFILDIVVEVIPGSGLSYPVHDLAWNEQSQKWHVYSLADNAFYQKVVNIPSVDLILGAAYLPQVMQAETKVINELMLTNTNFGWTILGPSSESTQFLIQVLAGANKMCYLSVQDIDDRFRQ